MRTIDLQLVEQGLEIRHCGFWSSFLGKIGRSAKSALVPSDHSVSKAEFSDLLVPDSMVTPQTMTEDDWLPVTVR
ncbi:MAG TPA: hypothetical protein VKP69_25230, partial [Isosphaeraceae bacterium]|nr:hypothetical protein [Isosphaeraceae bacterium]